MGFPRTCAFSSLFSLSWVKMAWIWNHKKNGDIEKLHKDALRDAHRIDILSVIEAGCNGQWEELPPSFLSSPLPSPLGSFQL